MTSEEIAKLLGGELLSNGTIACPGPGHSSNDRSLNIRIDPNSRDRFVVYSHSPTNSWMQCKAHIKALLGPYIVHLSLMAAPQTEEERSAKNDELVHYGRLLFGEGTPIKGTFVETYLTGRSIRNDIVGYCSTMLRAHPGIRFAGSGKWPAMLACYQDNLTGEFRGVHRTMLYSNGEAPLVDGARVKRMLGSARGASVRLTPPDLISDKLVVCEGIETGLSVIELFWEQRGPFHVWAAMTANGIAYFPVDLPCVRVLVAACDHDDNGASLTAAKGLQARWRERWNTESAGERQQAFEGWMPKQKGLDWNSVLETEKIT